MKKLKKQENISFRNIMNINGFLYKGKYWERDDGVCIELPSINEKDYIICIGDYGDVFYRANKYEIIGYLSVNNIINRLF